MIKFMITLTCSIILGCLLIQPMVYAEERNNENDERNPVNYLAPQKIKQFQEGKDVEAEQKSNQNIRRMYGDINFVDLRSLGGVVVVNSGSSGEKNSFESLSGWSVDFTWEFPVLWKQLGGGSPILKLRGGNSKIKMQSTQSGLTAADNASTVGTLGVSDVYTWGIGGGYCYGVGFQCIYGLYDSYLTGQLSSVNQDGTVSTVPTQLTGFTLGMSSTFDIAFGIELTLGMEYSMLEHTTNLYEKQKINTLGINFGFGLIDRPRYIYMKPVEYVN